MDDTSDVERDAGHGSNRIPVGANPLLGHHDEVAAGRAVTASAARFLDARNLRQWIRTLRGEADALSIH